MLVYVCVCVHIQVLTCLCAESRVSPAKKVSMNALNTALSA